MSSERNLPCPCGSGKKFKKCCANHVSPMVMRNDLTGERTIKMTDGIAEIFEGQQQRFLEKFGRKMWPGDPVFFDPDADVPTPLTEEKIKKGCVEVMKKAGMPKDFIYAYEKTGMMVVQENKHLFTKDDIQEWEDAVREYFTNQSDS